MRSEPLFFTDHPVHTHRVYMYREALGESGLPWGYDPAVGAGTVMPPSQDVGAKIHQLTGALLAFLPPGEIVRLLLFAAVLLAPLGTLLACRRLGFSVGQQACVMAALLGVIWAALPSYFSLGLVSFAAASLLTPYVLVLFLAFVSEPGYKRYAACVAALALLLLLHVLGPFVIAPSLVLLTLAKPGLGARWRLALVCVPILIALLNGFWLAPFVLAETNPQIAPAPIAEMELDGHLTASDWSDSLATPSLDRIVRRAVGVTLGVYGLVVLYRTVSLWAFLTLVTAMGFAVALRFFGSFFPVIVTMQPLRFIAPAVVLLTIPAGLALESLGRRFRLRSEFSAALGGFVLVGAALFLGRPTPLPLPPSPDPLRAFLAARTTTEDRLLVQSDDGYRRSGYEAKAFPIAYDHEVIGNTFPETHDPAQFHSDFLWGRPLASWRPDDLRSTLERWGVTWVFVQTDDARQLIEAATGDPGESVGPYQAFQVPSASPSRFLVGRGRLTAKVNRIELTDLEPQDGLIVLRYRYHPAWRTDSGETVLRYPVPEDQTGFLALEAPSRDVTLHFDPASIFGATWPEPIRAVELVSRDAEPASDTGNHNRRK